MIARTKTKMQKSPCCARARATDLPDARTSRHLPTNRVKMNMTDTDDDVQAIERLSEASGRIRAELSKVIVGQQDVLEELLIALFAQGHCLLVGVPGLAKTMMIRTLARAL